jgi:hypothetical protein
MEFYTNGTERLGLREIPPFVADLIRRIPRWSDEETEKAEGRLFPAPTRDPDEAELRSDWQAFVEPELHEYFRSTRSVVEADLHGMKADGECFALEFPLRHGEAWLNALNQARLALAERHGFDENDISRRGVGEILSERDLALFQIHLYEILQQWLIEILDHLEET